MKKNATLTFKYILIVMMLLVSVANIPCNVVYADEEETAIIEETVEAEETQSEVNLEEDAVVETEVVVEEIELEETVEVVEVVEASSRKQIEVSMHDNCFNKHVTEVRFVDEEGNIISSKKLISDSAVPLPGQGIYSTKTYTDENGSVHTFLGWFLEDGTIVEKAERGYYSYSECKVIIITAKWSVEVHNPALVNHTLIDLISDGSMSYTNDYMAIDVYHHEFTKPSDVEGYTFVGWYSEDGLTYIEGDCYELDCTNLKNDDVVSISHQAMWQPWLTVNFFDGEELITTLTLKDFGDSYTIDFEELSEELVRYHAGKTLNGYVVEGGQLVEGVVELSMPEITSEKVEENTINFYADYTLNTYTVRFIDFDGSLINETEYKYGDSLINIPEALTRKSDGKYTYKFVGWDNELVDVVTEDLVYIAQYKETKIVVPEPAAQTVEEDKHIVLETEIVVEEEVKEPEVKIVEEQYKAVEETFETLPAPAVGNTTSFFNANTMMVALLVVSIAFIIVSIKSTGE